MGLIPGWGRSPRQENDSPLQCSCQEIPWTEEPGGPQSMGLKKKKKRAGHGLATKQQPWIMTTSVCILSHSRSWGTSSSVLLWKHIVVCVVCELSLRSWRSLAWVTAYSETSDTDLGKALPAALGAQPTHPVSTDCTGGRGPSQPGRCLPHLRSSLWPWKPLSHIWMDRQQRKPNGLRNISVIYATNVFMFRDRMINLFYIFICKCGAAPVLL